MSHNLEFVEILHRCSPPDTAKTPNDIYEMIVSWSCPECQNEWTAEVRVGYQPQWSRQGGPSQAWHDSRAEQLDLEL
jgi:hypothetical protein